MGLFRKSSLLVGLLTAVLCFVGAAPRRPQPITFPAGFLWGAATSAHQVEGGNYNNDYYLWEKAGKTADMAGIADDQYHRYAGDFDLAQQMNHNAFRMSIEWSRIEPTEGKFDYAQIQHYRDVLQSARDHGLKTFVTLHHFTNPIWVASQGGWSNDAMPEWFGAYASFVVPNIGDLVDFWLTVNEPNVTVLTGYIVGLTPPGKTDVSAAAHVLGNFLKGHARAYRVIHAFYPNAKVGFAHHMRVFEGNTWWNIIDPLVASWIDTFWNSQLLQSIKTGHIYLDVPFVAHFEQEWPELKGAIDFIGVNYYTRDLIKVDLASAEKFDIMVKQGVPVNDLGWEIYPHGFYQVLMKAASFGWPVYVTENGIADAADTMRRQFLCDHLKELAHARQDGADIRGYLHWALLDNWEWIEGFRPRFGLVAVDYATQNRTIRASAQVLSEAARTNTLKVCGL